MLEFGVLGPLQVLEDGQAVALPRRRQRALLAVLLLHTGVALSSDRLIEELWGERPPRTARDALQNYVSQLRKVLGAGVLRTHDAGYALELEPDQLDLCRFERWCAEAKASPDAAGQAEKLRAALGLWRGEPLADLVYEPFAALEIARLQELRLATTLDLFDAELELRSGDRLPEIDALIERHPYDERLRGQQMLALYRAGRQSDALDAYQTTRRLLDEELGLEPGPALRELEQAILSQDPALSIQTRLPSPIPASRRTVTVLFANLVDSTSQIEHLDPEATDALLSCYFQAARTAVEHHGGTLDKVSGDTVMAVFGVPKAHEDDALRAVRAAVDIRDALDVLEGRLEARIGIDTGEVFTGGSNVLVTGGTVNLAKRLEQDALAGEILIGAATLRLIRDAVKAEPIAPLHRGEEEPRFAFRVLDVSAGAPGIARRFDLPLIGREQDFAQLKQAWELVQRERYCQVITVLGEAGIGKTRLILELISELGEQATVLTGTCVSYGEGATYLPLDQMLQQAGESFTTLTVGASSTGEISFLVRRRFEDLATHRPHLLIFEDVHWAEATLLDLIDDLGEKVKAPILCLCSARPDLQEAHPTGGRTVVELAALSEAQTQQLVDSLVADLDPELRTRIVETSEGNPLFTEQLVSHAYAEGPKSLDRVPPSIEALLASRLDLLNREDRVGLQHAAVIGPEFTTRAIEALGSVETLPNLERRGLVHLRGDRFHIHHVLIRDVAYMGIPKAERAALHERYADWLEGVTDESVDTLDEIVGYHLEQAAHYKRQLGQVDPELTERAGAWLSTAGRRALSREDQRAAASLLARAVELTRMTRFDVHLELDLAVAVPDPQESAEIAEAAAERAQKTGDKTAEAIARVVAIERHLLANVSAVDELEVSALAALSLVDEVNDHRGLVHVWSALGMVASVRGHFDKWAEASEHTLIHSRVTGHLRGAYGLSAALVAGPRPADEALRTLQSHTDIADAPEVQLYSAWLLAMLGSFDEAWAIAYEASKRARDTGSLGVEHQLAGIATLAGDHEAAATYRRAFCTYIESLGGLAHLSSHAPELGRSLCKLGHFDAAKPLAQLGRELGDEHDALTQILWRQVEALVLAHAGDHVQASSVGREAVAIAARTDALNTHADALCDLSEVLMLAGHVEEATEELGRALRLYEQKRNLVMAEQVRTRLNELTLSRDRELPGIQPGLR
jgi:DNA-binding SARP family transcriptional activator